MNNDRPIFIYGLVDPRDNSVRYVGKTIHPQIRYKNHLNEKKATKKGFWIRKLKRLRLKPTIIFLQIFFDESLWEKLEIKWVSRCRQMYGNLVTNGTDGGDGVHNPSAYSINKMVKARKLKFSNPEYAKKFKELMNSPERSKKISDALTGKKRGPHTKEWHDAVSKKVSGKNNPMYGKGFYKVWIEKYGQQKADEMLAELKKKHSKLNSGKNNPMAGNHFYRIWVKKYGKEIADQKLAEVNKIKSEKSGIFAKTRKRGAHARFIKEAKD